MIRPIRNNLLPVPTPAVRNRDQQASHAAADTVTIESPADQARSATAPIHRDIPARYRALRPDAASSPSSSPPRKACRRPARAAGPIRGKPPKLIAVLMAKPLAQSHARKQIARSRSRPEPQAFRIHLRLMRLIPFARQPQGSAHSPMRARGAQAGSTGVAGATSRTAKLVRDAVRTAEARRDCTTMLPIRSTKQISVRAK